ncbi:Arc family DNA-binding protein [Agrobacterium salinitolerans]
MAIKKRFPSDKADQYIVRFPEGMRDTIKAEAEKNGRSMNSEIIARISRTLIEDDFMPKYIQRHEEMASDLHNKEKTTNKLELLAEELLRELRQMRAEDALDTEEK